MLAATVNPAFFSNGAVLYGPSGAGTAVQYLKSGGDGTSSWSTIDYSTLSGLPALGTLAFQNGAFSGTSSGTNTGDQTSVSGNAGSATVLQTSRNINGVSFNGSANITVTAAAGTLTGTTLNASVVTSSLTAVGTLTNLTVTNPITGSVTGNAATVTTNANMTGPITSTGNATSIASQTGTGSTFAMSAGPTITGTLTAAIITASGAISTTVSGSASVSAMMLSGAIFTGGTGTTNFPQLFIQPSTAAAFTGWSANGTALGMNMPNGYTGNLIDCRVNTTSGQFTVSAGGTIVTTGRFTTSTPVAASVPAIGLTGPLFTGGTGTTNVPQYLSQSTSATAATSWSIAGTYFAANANTGFSGNFFDFRINGALTLFGQLTSAGALTIGSSITTGTPNGGTSGAWKLGVLVTTTTVFDTTRYAQVDINGTLYKVGLCI